MQEVEIERLIDEERIKIARKDAESRASELSTEEWYKLRRLCKRDLFFLAYSVLGYTRLSVNLHGHLCKWVIDTEDKRFREELLPRGHFKSTLITIADSIRIVLPNDDNGYQVWPHCLGPESRILLAHETHTSAGNLFLGPIIGHFLSNPLLMALFPECVPDPRKQRVNKNELELPRKSIWGEPTFDTLGTGGRAQGRHYNFLKLDDLIGDKARDSKTEMQAAKDWFDNIESLFSTFKLDKFDLTGTRWAFDDLYAHAHRSYGDELTKYIRAVEETNEVTGKKETIFPEEFKGQLERLRRKPIVFNAQYLNDPSQSGTGFNPEWKQFYQYVPNTGNKKISYLNALGGEQITQYVSELDILFLIDPATVNEYGFIITGTNHRSKTFILEAVKHAWKPPEFVPFLFSKVIQYKPRTVFIEEVLFSKLYQAWLSREMSMRGTRFRIEGVQTKNKAKDQRILGLSTYFESGALVFNENHEDLIEEYKIFGNADPEQLHLLDALAQGIGRWRAPVAGFTSVDEEILVQQTRKIDPVSGYSTVKYK
jgi:predicted phage terminase large subunit-like protein